MQFHQINKSRKQNLDEVEEEEERGEWGGGRVVRWWWLVSTRQGRFGQSPKLSIMDYRGEIETIHKKKILRKKYNNEPRKMDKGIEGFPVAESVSFAN